MSSVIINPSQEASEQVAAIRMLARLQRTKPSMAAPLTDEDMAIWERQAGRCGDQFLRYAHAAYVEYFVFYGGEMGKAEHWCRERL
jgi:hypothetical protein